MYPVHQQSSPYRLLTSFIPALLSLDKKELQLWAINSLALLTKMSTEKAFSLLLIGHPNCHPSPGPLPVSFRFENHAALNSFQTPAPVHIFIAENEVQPPLQRSKLYYLSERLYSSTLGTEQYSRLPRGMVRCWGFVSGAQEVDQFIQFIWKWHWLGACLGHGNTQIPAPT